MDRSEIGAFCSKSVAAIRCSAVLRREHNNDVFGPRQCYPSTPRHLFNATMRDLECVADEISVTPKMLD